MIQIDAVFLSVLSLPSLSALAPRADRGAKSFAFHGGTTIRFATLDEAAEMLGKSDRYTQATSRFDRQARLKSAKPVSEQEMLKFAAQQASDWPDEDIERMTEACSGRLRANWPTWRRFSRYGLADSNDGP